MTRISVDKEALEALIDYANETRLERDSEGVAYATGHAGSEAEFKALVDALDPHPTP